MYMSYYGSFVFQCYVLRMRVMTSTAGGNLTNRPPALRHIHVNNNSKGNKTVPGKVATTHTEDGHKQDT